MRCYFCCNYHHFKLYFFLFSLLAFSSCNKLQEQSLDAELTGKSGTFENNSITVGGEKRNFRLVVAEKLDLSNPNKIIFAFHGLGIDSKDLMPMYSKLNDLAEELHAIIVYPNAQNGSWGLSQKQIEKDLMFFELLLESISSHYLIDEKNIHLTGMSNGAYFCHILAKNNGEKIASISAHIGMIGLEFALGIYAKRKYPVLLIHGEKDPIFSISIARNDLIKYKNEQHKASLIEVAGLGHEWANKINVNDSISKFIKENPLK